MFRSSFPWSISADRFGAGRERPSPYPAVIIRELFGYAHAMGDPVRVAGIQRALDRATVQSLSWALAAGLGPLLYRAIRNRPGSGSRELHDRLLGANLAAQVRHGELIDAALDVIELCLAAGVPVTLLKGISISEQHYPEGHLRPMTDIDILLPAVAFMSIEAQLLRLARVN